MVPQLSNNSKDYDTRSLNSKNQYKWSNYLANQYQTNQKVYKNDDVLSLKSVNHNKETRWDHCPLSLKAEKRNPYLTDH